LERTKYICDAVAPAASHPTGRNRYGYVLNNPLKYLDPSGHTPEESGQTQADKPGDCTKYANACYRIFLNFQSLGIDLGNWHVWDFDQLAQIQEAIMSMMDTFGWSKQTFMDKMGLDTQGRSILLVRDRNQVGPAGEVARFNSNGLDTLNDRRITIYESATSNWQFGAASIVHELAHAWDHAATIKAHKHYDGPKGGILSEGFRAATGGKYSSGKYIAGGQTASLYADSNLAEDWAESVAATVYPGSPGLSRPWGRDPVTRLPIVGQDNNRWNYVCSQAGAKRYC
jgi:hypothetical protein